MCKREEERNNLSPVIEPVGGRMAHYQRPQVPHNHHIIVHPHAPVPTHESQSNNVGPEIQFCNVHLSGRHIARRGVRMRAKRV